MKPIMKKFVNKLLIKFKTSKFKIKIKMNIIMIDSINKIKQIHRINIKAF